MRSKAEERRLRWEKRKKELPQERRRLQMWEFDFMEIAGVIRRVLIVSGETGNAPVPS